MKVSVIIATKDRPELLRHCLQSLARQEHLADELVIVDASTKPIKPQEVVPVVYHDAARLIRAQPCLTRQRNEGFRASQGDIVLYLDDDVVLEPGYIAALVAAFEQDRTGQVAAATGRITNINHPGWQHPLRSILWLFNLLFQLPDLGSGKFRLSGFPTFPYHCDTARWVETLSGCNMAFRREVLDHYQFDESLPGYGFMDDDDMAYRISRQYDCLYVADARLAHLSMPKERATLRSHKRTLARVHLYLFHKNTSHSLPNVLAFGISILGLVLATCIVERSLSGAWGILEGVRAGALASKDNSMTEQV